MSDVQELDSITAGEIPLPLTNTFLGPDGLPYDLTGFEAHWEQRNPDGSLTEKVDPAVAVDPDQVSHKGDATVTFTSTDFALPGPYSMELWVQKGTAAPRSAKEYRLYVRPAVSIPA